ncbi:hypothetical protein NIES4072_72480 [Nostoc commune NIES-4072]|uniref:Uncharacterized protein n=1 Tax=Nostoc commune NIES-4072 TaxID=2005467 RepID=A0A2R5FXP5_NOSCO|nr:hypothetical protein [Nostoc commune]BBD70019.1 hypothetical protein NIES4070_64300 [Nostoc commune HK-02]GBG23536.1 hypothetical protein NIES4072_72480 [Nostoc commune NIES-4072]
MVTTPINTELTLEKVKVAVDAILQVLGTPETELHSKALAAFNSGDHQTVKRLASTNLSDYYVKALGYLGGALKLTPNTDTILAESARAAADFSRERTLNHLGKAIATALG